MEFGPDRKSLRVGAVLSSCAVLVDQDSRGALGCVGEDPGLG